jgi:SAM-dependent methyltransferase
MGERIWRPVWTWGALSILVALGTWARMDGLGDWGLWRDEAQCVFIAQKAFPAGIVDALLGEAHPPLYYSLQHFWMQLVGWSEFRIRFLSVIFGILLIPALFIAGRRLFGTGAGLGAAVFGALAPLHVAVSQTARMYSLLALLALLSVWFLFEAWQRGGWWWAGYVLATLGVLYTHNWALFLVVAQNAFAFWMMLTRQTFRSRVLPWVGIQGSIGVLFMPWFVMILQQIPIISVLPFVPRLAPVDTLWRVGGDLLAAWPALLLWLAALALAIWPRMKWEPATEERDGALALAVWCSLGALAIGLIVSLQTYGGAPSYVTLVAFPALCLLLGRGLVRVRRPWLALPLAALIAYLSNKGRILALEIGEEMISRFKKKCSRYLNVSIQKMRIDEPLPFFDEFDKVLISFVLHGFPHEVRERVIKNAFKVLNRGGEFFILDYGEFALEKIPVYFRLPFKAIECKYAYDYLERDWKGILLDQGFSHTEEKNYLKGFVRLLKAVK